VRKNVSECSGSNLTSDLCLAHAARFAAQVHSGPGFRTCAAVTDFDVSCERVRHAQLAIPHPQTQNPAAHAARWLQTFAHFQVERTFGHVPAVSDRDVSCGTSQNAQLPILHRRTRNPAAHTGRRFNTFLCPRNLWSGVLQICHHYRHRHFLRDISECSTSDFACEDTKTRCPSGSMTHFPLLITYTS
jgi:hypothetical protein